jgi:hypothetical protein
MPLQTIRVPTLVLLAAGVSAAVGCDPSPIYDSPGRPIVGAVTERSLWRASGTVKDPASATDGSIDTAAVATNTPTAPTLTIDLGKPCLFNLLVLDHGREPFGFARRVVVATSLDGKTFAQQYAASGTRRVSTFLLVTPVLARYVQFQATAPGQKPWTVAEVHLQ